MTIRLEIVNDQHFTVSGDEPFRVETLVTTEGRVLAEVYTGSDPDPEQDPIGTYDGTVVERTSWEYADGAIQPVSG